MFFPENSVEAMLLEWIKKQKKRTMHIEEVLKADIDINTEEKRQALWRLLDNNDIDLSGDLKIITKTS